MSPDLSVSCLNDQPIPNQTRSQIHLEIQVVQPADAVGVFQQRRQHPGVDLSCLGVQGLDRPMAGHLGSSKTGYMSLDKEVGHK